MTNFMKTSKSISPLKACSLGLLPTSLLKECLNECLNLIFLFKLIEMVFVDQLTQYCYPHSLNDPLLSACRGVHSPQTALLNITNDILLNMDTQ